MFSFLEKILYGKNKTMEVPKGPFYIDSKNYMLLLNSFKKESRRDIIECLSIFSKDKKMLEEAYWFIPNIIFKLEFPDTKFAEPDKYIVEYPNSKRSFHSFSENELYKQLLFWVEAAWRFSDTSIVGNILSHSIEFSYLEDSLELGLRANQTYVVCLYKSEIKE